MDLADLEAFAMVIERGSMKKACDALGMSRTTLRRRLDALERELGATLLLRDERGVRPTRAGAAVIDRLPNLLGLKDDLRRLARMVHSEPSGRLRVVLPVGLPDRGQAEVVLRLLGLYPHLNFEVTEVSEPLSHLDTPFDMMLHFGPPPSQGGWFSRVLRRARLQLFGSERYLARTGTPSRVEDLAHHRLLHWRVAGIPTDAWPLHAGGEIAIRPWCSSWNVQFLHALADEGGGLLLAPDDLPVHHPLREPLVPVLKGEVGGELPFRLLSPAPMNADPNTREMLRSIQQALADLPTE